MLTSQLAGIVAAQEQDDGSDMDYESIDEDMEDASTLTADQPPVKKQKQKN